MPVTKAVWLSACFRLTPASTIPQPQAPLAKHLLGHPSSVHDWCEICNLRLLQLDEPSAMTAHEDDMSADHILSQAAAFDFMDCMRMLLRI